MCHSGVSKQKAAVCQDACQQAGVGQDVGSGWSPSEDLLILRLMSPEGSNPEGALRSRSSGPSLSSGETQWKRLGDSLRPLCG